MRQFMIPPLMIFVAVMNINAVKASPQADFVCKGAATATAAMFPDLGGAGEFLYKLNNDKVGLVGYSEPSEQLSFEAAGHEGKAYRGHGLHFFESSE